MLCRVEGAFTQIGCSEARFVGKWVPVSQYKGSASLVRGLSSFEYFTTRQMITDHLRHQIEEMFDELVSFCDGMMLVGGNLPKGEAEPASRCTHCAATTFSSS